MRFADVANIWSTDLSSLSKRDRGRVYFERAKDVVSRALASPAERRRVVRQGRFNRAYLIEQIGCRPAVATQNPRVRQLLLETDREIQRTASEPASVDAENALARERATSLSKIGQPWTQVKVARPSRLGATGKPRQAATPDVSLGLIISTNADCQIQGHSWPGIPTLVWPDGIDEAASDWLRGLVVDGGVAISSAHEYANVLRPFLRFCRERGRAWDSVDDQFLIIWREHLRRALGLSISRINASLKTIFAFYRWSEESKRVQFKVGIYTQDELPDVLQQTVFPISAKRSFSKGRSGRTFGNWTTPLTITGQSQPARVRHTPNEDQIRNLHTIVAEHEQGERDSLMFSWAEEAGPRRAEFLSVGKSQLPTLDQLADLIDYDEPWIIEVKRKGGKIKSLPLPLDLITRTLDYVQFGRQEIVDRCLDKIASYREPDEIFLSSTTGMPLHPDSVTSIGRRAFRKAGMRRANIHRLRARFAVRTIETLVDAIFDGTEIGATSSWVETILVKAAEMMGHSSPRSLKPYLTYVLNRRVQNADATKAEQLSSRLRQLALHEDTLVRRLAQQQHLLRVARDIQAGRNADAARELRAIANQLD